MSGVATEGEIKGKKRNWKEHSMHMFREKECVEYREKNIFGSWWGPATDLRSAASESTTSYLFSFLSSPLSLSAPLLPYSPVYAATEPASPFSFSFSSLFHLFTHGYVKRPHLHRAVGTGPEKSATRLRISGFKERAFYSFSYVNESFIFKETWIILPISNRNYKLK